jgi:hypothetical protein
MTTGLLTTGDIHRCLRLPVPLMLLAHAESLKNLPQK